ncbi:MAG: 50S ribosomal protein L2 [Parachlamydiaceae bacterium]|nr:50S ribosomal protein L2 [Parachlamydiaceae bacterium]
MLKKYRPVTPGTRQLLLPMHEELTRVEGSRATVKPNKNLLLPKRRTSGRNNNGHITCRHKGGGHKQHYRIVDFKRDKEDIPARVASIEYDPNRSAYLALLNYADGEKRYIIAQQGLKVGATVQTSAEPPFHIGNCMRLKHMPLGSTISCIEMRPGKGAKMVRSAGMSAQLMARSGGYATLRMPSGEVRMVNEDCKATFGAVSNPGHNLRVEGKAGRMRWKGVRPTVRGVAMNPVDHPHGGGEGKHKGNIPQTPWAMFTRGYRTRSLKKSNKFIVKDRRKK